MYVSPTLNETRRGRDRLRGDAHGPRASSRFRLRKNWDDNQVIGPLGKMVDEVVKTIRSRGWRDFDITEIDIADSDITQFDKTDTDISESDITEIDITRKGKLI